jgi:hypothetical protein
MLVNVSSTTAPTWSLSNELENPLTKTRIVTINIIWFVVFLIISTIAIVYTRSISQELDSFQYKHHRISVYALYTQLLQQNAELFRTRHEAVVRETTRRMRVLLGLLIMLFVNWLPNFILIMCQVYRSGSALLKFLTVLGSLFWLLNPLFNSITFVVLLMQQVKFSANPLSWIINSLAQQANKQHNPKHLNLQRKIGNKLRNYEMKESQGSLAYISA